MSAGAALRSVAVVGSGPAGLYAAEGLARKHPDLRIDVIERLPTPFGLVRSGVAPDHQGTKAIQRQFGKLLQRPGLRFLGNVEVGRDVSLDELRAIYDAVILAIGAALDRRLGIPGEDLPGVYGSGAFVGWYNGHPDWRDLDPRLAGPSVAIIGNGNVAVDVARVLAKSPAEMTASDICAHAAATIAAAPVAEIWLIGRRGPAEASWTPAELAELGRLERAAPVIDPAGIPECIDESDARLLRIREKNLEILRGFAAEGDRTKPIRLRFLFNAAPVEIAGDGRAERLRLARRETGEAFEIPASTVITAIGYRCFGCAGAPLDAERGTIANLDGRVAPGLWVVGWAKRGPSGTIPTNRAESFAVAESVAAELAQGNARKPGPDALDRLLAGRGVTVIDRPAWLRIDAAEAARARPGAPREKLVTIVELVAAASGDRFKDGRVMNTKAMVSNVPCRNS
ncbi:MAG: NADP oxidoreductase [Alphaproteobacteria bacterium]|nr:MAG: NADP oxidoreductase [Alphaproteobacteria bacterium]